MFFCGTNDFGDWLLDAEVDSFESVVAQNDFNEILADVVHIASNRRQQNLAFADIIGFF